MANRTFSVYFAKPRVGQQAEPLAAHLTAAHAIYGEHLPPFEVEGDKFQVRNLLKVGTVWQGTFARLREDAPNYVEDNTEKEFALAEGAAVIEKCQFLYREQSNVLVWQVSMQTGSLNKAATYVSFVLEQVTIFPMVQNNAQLEQMLQADLYEIDFQYAQPPNLPDDVHPWSQRAFDIIKENGASYARFTLRAKRGQTLAARAKENLAEMVGHQQYKRIRVRASADSDPVKLFLAPLKEQFTIDVLGRYPRSNDVYEGLESAYTRQQDSITANAA